VERFRREGYRMTPQRMRIFEVIEAGTPHTTVESIHQQAVVTMPTLSLATVYQTVHELRALGEVALHDLGLGRLVVDVNVEHPHQHLVCTGCGDVADVDVHVDGAALAGLGVDDFTVERVDVVFRGRCRACGPATPPD
jgi:Fur family transcriptional regulator, stress-responsive regulator